jgi:hypothetical protein
MLLDNLVIIQSNCYTLNKGRLFMAEDLLLLSGNANLKLSKSISDRLSIELVNAVIGLFRMAKLI